MGLIDSAKLNNLKARVKQECSRRNMTGSVAAYAGTEYDYTITPSDGVTILQEHYEKLAVPLNAINNKMQSETDGDRIVSEEELDAMATMLTTLEARKYYDNSGSDCSASCTGMCYSCTGTCSGGCSGCTGCSGCGGMCSYSCSGGCDSSCTQTCGGDGCVGQCVLTCYGSCEGYCKEGCSGGCGTDCTGTCGYSCSFCSGTCSGVSQYN